MPGKTSKKNVVPSAIPKGLIDRLVSGTTRAVKARRPAPPRAWREHESAAPDRVG